MLSMLRSSKIPVMNFGTASLSIGATFPSFNTKPFFVIAESVAVRPHASMSLSRLIIRSNWVA